jgi:hypothetical protein
MAEGRQRSEWGQTSLLAAGIFRQTADPKKKPPKPSDFDPFHAKDETPLPLNAGDLKTALLARGWKLSKIRHATDPERQPV